ncbi:unnamed protein product [Caretta caretta]
MWSWSIRRLGLWFAAVVGGTEMWSQEGYVLNQSPEGTSLAGLFDQDIATQQPPALKVLSADGHDVRRALTEHGVKAVH